MLAAAAVLIDAQQYIMMKYRSVATVGNAELDLTIAALQPAGDTLVNSFVPMSRRGA